MIPHGLRHLLIAPLFLLGSLAHADAIVGRVVDANGVGVPGVDIDFVRLGGGGNPHEMNDGTDANGFFVTTVDADIYEIRFFPPVPPTTTLLTGVLPSVVVVGTVDLGTIVLEQGVSLKGRMVNDLQQPVANVNVDVIDPVTGKLLLMKNDKTTAFGTFEVAIPTRALEVQLLTSAIVGQTLVPQRMDILPTGALDLGTRTLETGYHVTGTVRRTNLSPVANSDMDARDLASGQKLWTPNDNTNSLGVFDMVVPAGDYEISVCPPPAQLLVGGAISPVSVASAVDVGTLTLATGTILSGVVHDVRGQPAVGVNVDAFLSAGAQPIVLCGDNTNASGAYSIIVPLSTIDVVFKPAGPHTVFSKDWHRDLMITGPTTLNGVMPSPTHGAGANSPIPGSSIPTLFGTGWPGTGGLVPRISWSGGTPSATGSGYAVGISNARPNAPASVRIGTSTTLMPFGLHFRTVIPEMIVTGTTDGLGRLSLPMPPFAPATAGLTLYNQALVLDPNAVGGVAYSRVLRYSLAP